VGVLLAAALALADLGRLVVGPRGAAAGHPERLQAGERQVAGQAVTTGCAGCAGGAGAVLAVWTAGGPRPGGGP